MGHSVYDINQMNEADFVELLGSVFEDTPAVAERAWASRPFQDVADLHQKMVAVVEAGMIPDEKLMLIQSHPELGTSGKMAAASVQEQAGVGLNQMEAAVYQQIHRLNAAYREKFGFPFVMAVKGQTLERITTALESRLQQEKEDEMARSLSEIYKITRFRLDDLIET
ncbi:MAG: OHCU decarboxylase [Leptolyngbya foveolarum]|uniref:2-oxo-4-hydroxy-4-carboxy-5-ureidoimidazoline decarboxylase n=1 Tax=Leptolyngbya foveolarum TaxID=47253 RepID=A0A2W4TWS5_9CYAN|nr:MAG: OHCU decarboxylase [Leptolyngbya foveolarum]